MIATATQIGKLLHVGCGYREGGILPPAFATDAWEEIRLDIDPDCKPDIVNSITAMCDVDDCSFDVVYSCHNLEHLGYYEVRTALAEFYRVLKPGGVVIIIVPDMKSVCAVIATGNLEGKIYETGEGMMISPIDCIYGHRSRIAAGYIWQLHRTGFTADTLPGKLSAVGFVEVAAVADKCFNVTAKGRKPTDEHTTMMYEISIGFEDSEL